MTTTKHTPTLPVRLQATQGTDIRRDRQGGAVKKDEKKFKKPREFEFPKPVKIFTCYICHGDGYVVTGGITQRCVNCYGRGRIATEAGEP